MNASAKPGKAPGAATVAKATGPEKPARRPQPALSLSLQFAEARWRAALPRHRVVRWLRAALQRPAELTVRVVGDDEARRLNRHYRGIDHATNVLTFDYQHQPVVLADLVLAGAVVEREAQALGLALEHHFAHLLVHGVLHAQGMDHQQDEEARRMEARETQVMLALGLHDPYVG